MDGVEASIGIGMQSAWVWYPPFEDGSQELPAYPSALTAPCQYTTPQSVDADSERTQPIDVAGYSVVLVVAENDLPKPGASLSDGMVLSSL